MSDARHHVFYDVSSVTNKIDARIIQENGRHDERNVQYLDSSYSTPYKGIR